MPDDSPDVDSPADAPEARKTPGIRPTPVRRAVPARPAWARRLDRWSLRLVRLAERILPRPDDDVLEKLARADRGPAPDIPRLRLPSIDAARRAFSEGRYGEALHRFGELIAEDPDNAWAWHGRGDALQLLGQHADALAAYDRACALAPHRGIHQGGRANALEALGRHAEAEAAWAEALRLDPDLSWMREGRDPPG